MNPRTRTTALFSATLLLAGCAQQKSVIVPIDPTGGGPTAPLPFTITVTLTDGDQAKDILDAEGVPIVDADTVTIDITNTASENTNIVRWEIGLVRTPPTVAGWTGEDCNGLDHGQGDVCHTLSTADGTKTLHRVYELGAVTDGSTIFAVDYPETDTPQTTYVFNGHDSTGTIVACWVYGDLSYYPNLGCMSYVPGM